MRALTYTIHAAAYYLFSIILFLYKERKILMYHKKKIINNLNENIIPFFLLFNSQKFIFENINKEEEKRSTL